MNPPCRARPAVLLPILLGLNLVGLAMTGRAARLPGFEFTTPSGIEGWTPTHDLNSLQPSAEGLVATLSGPDPYFTGPPRDYPAGTPLWIHVRLKSDRTGIAQIFYFAGAATEEQSVRFPVPGGVWHEARVLVPPLGTGFHLRVDPPGSSGRCVLARIWFEERLTLQPPTWPQPAVPDLSATPLAIGSGRMSLVHGRAGPGEFEVRVEGTPMATGHNRTLAGYHAGGETRWLPLTAGPNRHFTLSANGPTLAGVLTAVDTNGGRWTFRQEFSPAASNTIRVTVSVSVDQDRSAVFLPMFMLIPGLGTFGTNKHQALLAGVEYLENEPSSSEADVRGAGAKRQVPDNLKLTLPLMALEQAGRYVGLIWEPQPQFCAVFDSPDRLFGSRGHVLGLLAPGSDGANREEGSLLPYEGVSLRAGQPLILQALLIGGTGESVVPAVQHYIALRGLPPVPSPGLVAVDYYRLAAHGWLDSKIREGDLYRHAYWPGFGAQPAVDAAVWMDWLAPRVEDPVLAARLQTAAAGARSAVTPAQFNQFGAGHIRDPVPALAYGAVLENAAAAASQGQARLGQFQGCGTVFYEPPANGTDYSVTHWSKEANGLVGAVLVNLLQDAAFSGDASLQSQALQHLRGLAKFHHTVPRGAQTWEIPLHTPDILASAHLVRAYVLGFELSGDRAFLEQARYWAWTGVPFVYLSPPTSGPVGLYNTIAVLGATSWIAPVWIGLPVQWCGLVYGQALYELARYDSAGPWHQIADGIAVAGVQQSWPVTDPERQGLLPDSFVLRAQLRDGPPINPATVQSQAVQFFTGHAAYHRVAFLRHGLMAHAAGSLAVQEERADGVKFRVDSWTHRNTWMLLTGLRRAPQLRLNEQAVPLAAPHQYQPSTGRLVLLVPPDGVVEILYPSLADF